MRAEVPVPIYLSMCSKHRKNAMTSLQNQRISNGKVIFKGEEEIAILRALIDSHNNNTKMPIGFVGRKPVYATKKDSDDKEWDGPDPRLMGPLLEGFHEDGDYFAFRCPVHKGVGVTSGWVRRESGHFGCHSGCDAGEITIVLNQLLKDNGGYP